MDTMAFATKLLEEADVAVSPGSGFGPSGEGYLRLALVENENRLRQAVRQIGQCLKGSPTPAPEAAVAPAPAPAAPPAQGLMPGRRLPRPLRVAAARCASRAPCAAADCAACRH